ncbi:hypothetical protein [Micromonospora sp. CB01531]|uniref:hypothetical protein n=1 Tax=Micromonospora sp. CB01531 TaxID=1718947 RepID=UPI00093DB353|nr:hypothetical protein [Micromonospora sp. CB01531]OKI47210.1 hypothetical protein A6A27_10185 [Micromonospora sp. CB01531]
MTTTTLPRLPRELLASLTVAVPVRKNHPRFTAHRVERVYNGERTAGQLRWEQNKGGVLIVPACLPKGQVPDVPHHELSGPMADHVGAVACTKPACFPGAAAPGPNPMGAEQPVTVPPGGPTAEETVWIAAARREIEAHRIDEPLTGCGRSTRTGQRLAAGQAWGLHEARWCRRCWPSKA